MMTKGSFAKRMKGPHDLKTMREIKTPLDLGRIRIASRGEILLQPTVDQEAIARSVARERERFAKANQTVRQMRKKTIQNVLKNQAILASRYQYQRDRYEALKKEGD